MDTLALLCNLYGDGPQTLRRLREAGCGTLSSLETLECERLASLLRTSVRSAKRFQVEGRLLRERSEHSGDRATARRPSDPPAAPKNALVASVLTAWRERDARTGDGPLASAGALAVEVPRAPAAEPREDLAGLDGMDAALLARLRESGVTTLDALREADVLDLAGRGIAGFTRLLHLQFLARRVPAGPSHGARGVAPKAGDAASAAAPTTDPAQQAGAAVQDLGAPSVAAAEPAVQASEATPFAAGITLEVAAEAARDDVLVPVRALERRGSTRSAAFPAAVAPRFSPRLEPQAAQPLPLEADLARHAAARRADEALGSGTAAHDEAGSSGPFA